MLKILHVLTTLPLLLSISIKVAFGAETRFEEPIKEGNQFIFKEVLEAPKDQPKKSTTVTPPLPLLNQSQTPPINGSVTPAVNAQQTTSPLLNVESQNQIALKTIQIQPSFLDAKFIAFLNKPFRPDDALPFVLFSGRTCDNCDESQKSFYIFNLKQNSKIYMMIQPGKIIDTKKKALISDSRSFYGQCLNYKDIGFYSFRREHVNKRRGSQKSVYSAILQNELDTTYSNPLTELKENIKEGKNLPKIETALHFVKQKKCFELPKVTRYSLKKAFDLGPNRVGQEEEDEDAIETEKEKELEKSDSSQPINDSVDGKTTQKSSSINSQKNETENTLAQRDDQNKVRDLSSLPPDETNYSARVVEKAIRIQNE